MTFRLLTPTGATAREQDLLRAVERALNTSGPVRLPSHTVTTLPDATDFTGSMIYVSNETGGAVPAFSDGTNWRRVTDRAIVS